MFISTRQCKTRHHSLQTKPRSKKVCLHHLPVDSEAAAVQSIAVNVSTIAACGQGSSESSCATPLATPTSAKDIVFSDSVRASTRSFDGTRWLYLRLSSETDVPVLCRISEASSASLLCRQSRDEDECYEQSVLTHPDDCKLAQVEDSWRLPPPNQKSLATDSSYVGTIARAPRTTSSTVRKKGVDTF